MLFTILIVMYVSSQQQHSDKSETFVLLIRLLMCLTTPMKRMMYVHTQQMH